ncbi:hypothetical protein [Anaeromyxobacter oryzae]|uniref:Uncharacterized protein n=1 Tax=Anaeromyxobacter oryzae TaxID=2918170 RepID=A0ABN6MZE1_9BACT|nr:hypothetical protein [Anaeromyxobacter oryzae]BDG06317.1 hypothetical protein AMOR_53130 [Anaeromyxobacter oryzae]
MLSVGDWVEVLPAKEILATLDEDGAVEHLPFMPEMLSHCGRRYRVSIRAERTCVRGAPPGAHPIRRLDDAVVLDGLRCDGRSHGGCQLGCSFYWKERWLRRVEGPADEEPRDAASAPELPIHPRSDPTAFVCQGTELARATRPAEPLWSPGQYVRMLRVRTLTLPQLVSMYAGIAAARLERELASRRPPRPTPPHGPDEVLGLKPGEWVQVKSKAEILETLDARGTHRGLSFMNHYEVYCGKTLRVQARVERIIVEETGKLRAVRDTVILEGSVCPRYHGCARGMPPLWREAWLRRATAPGT